VPDVNRIFQIEMFGQRREIVCVVVHVASVARLTRDAAAIGSDTRGRLGDRSKYFHDECRAYRAKVKLFTPLSRIGDPQQVKRCHVCNRTKLKLDFRVLFSPLAELSPPLHRLIHDFTSCCGWNCDCNSNHDSMLEVIGTSSIRP